MKVKFLMGPSECNDLNIPAYSENFLKELSAEMDEKIECAEIDEVAKESLPIYFIASGGSENAFKAVFKATKSPYVLLTSPAYNSLAAAMEIMEFLHQNGFEGEILHGTPKEISARLSVLKKAKSAQTALSGSRLGCFGEPNGLIASTVDDAAVKKTFGIEMVHLELAEVVSEFNNRNNKYPQDKWTEDLFKHKFDSAEIEKALQVYAALCVLIERHKLNGLAIRCFDLLKLIRTTGCLALAILNVRKIPAACEGDQKTLVSMALMNAISGQPGFMSNPSFIKPSEKEIVLAHCTLPLDMCDNYTLDTHFESRIGVAVSCQILPCDMTIFKCDGTFRHHVERAHLIETMQRQDLCRSQMRLKLLDEGAIDYFSHNTIGNHHVVCKGDHKAVIEEFFKQIKMN